MFLSDDMSIFGLVDVKAVFNGHIVIRKDFASFVISKEDIVAAMFHHLSLMNKNFHVKEVTGRIELCSSDNHGGEKITNFFTFEKIHVQSYSAWFDKE